MSGIFDNPDIFIGSIDSAEITNLVGAYHLKSPNREIPELQRV